MKRIKDSNQSFQDDFLPDNKSIVKNDDKTFFVKGTNQVLYLADSS